MMKVKDDLLKAGLVEKHQQIAELEEAQARRRHTQDEFTSQITPQMQVILDSMSELVIFQDKHNRILWVNRAAAESVGMTPEELVGRHCYQVWHQRQPCDGCPVVKARETGKPQEAEITTPDGRTWLMRSNPVRDGKGKVVGVVEVTLEITERKTKEKEYQTVLRTVMDGLWIMDSEGRFLDVNDAYCGLVGYSREELLNMNIWDLAAVEKPEETAQRIQKSIRTGSDHFETRHRCKDGRIIDVEVNIIHSNIRGGRFFVFVRDITERKQAEEVLKKSEEKYRYLVENINEVIFTTDSEGCITYISPVIERITKYKVNEILGKHFSHFIHADDLPGLQVEFENTLAGSLEPYEFRLIDKDGEIIHIRASGGPLVVNGQVVGITGSLIDITERKQAEEASKRAMERLQHLVGASPVVIYSFKVGGDWRVTFVSENVLKVWGYAPQEFLENRNFWIEHVHPDDRERYFREFAKLLEKGYHDIEYRVLFADGTYHWIRDELRLICDGEGNPVECIGSVVDVTKQKQAEEASRESREAFQKIFECVTDGISVIDLDGIIIEVNDRTVEMHGFSSKDELLGKSAFELVAPGDRERIANNMRQAIKRGAIRGVEYTLLRADGSEFPAELSTSVLKDASGNLVAHVTIARDITERKEAAARLSKLYSIQTIEKDIAERMLGVREETELFQQVCDLLAKLEFIKLVWIGLIEKESYEIKPVAWAGFERGLLSVIKVTWDDSGYGRGPGGTSIKTGQPFVAEDIEQDTRHRPWREELLKRGYVSSVTLPIVHKGEVIGVLCVYSGTKGAFGDDEVEFLTRVADDIGVGVKTLRLQKDLERSLERAKSMLEGTIEAVVAVSETRDPYTAGHQRRVAKLASAIAEELGMPEEQIEAVRVAGLLHDIGKVHVPAEILSKPGRLNEVEMDLVKTHSQASVDILKTVCFPWSICSFVLQHHERMDGSGYPNALSGNDISLEARILAVADVVEAMASHRPYRPALGIDKALDEISRNKGILYDPEVVNTCLRLFTKKGFTFE